MKLKKKLFTEYIRYYNEYYGLRYAYINILKKLRKLLPNLCG